MMSSATNEIEQLLAVPPPNFCGQTNNPHAIAHAVLENLRESGDVHLLFLRVVLEQPSNKEELLFHCITGVRHVFLTQWNSYSDGFTATIRDLFLQLGDSHAGRSKTIQMACYTTSVAFWKRSWMTTEPQSQASTTQELTPTREQEQAILEQIGTSILRIHNKGELFSHLQSRIGISNNNPNHMQTTCLYLSALLGEFSGKSSVPYRLPMEFHKKSHKCFEEEHLLYCLELAMGALASIVNANNATINGGSCTDQSTAVSVVQLTIDILGWGFGMSEYLHLSSTSILIRPPTSWRNYLMRPDFLGAVFSMHHANYNNIPQQPLLAHSLRQLLLLLCSLSGPIFQETSERESFAHYLCEGTCQLLRTCQEQGEGGEDSNSALLFDTFSLVARLFTNFRLAILSRLPTLIPLLQELTKTGTALLHANVRECQAAGGDAERMEHREWREEALSILLEAILILSGDQWLQDPRAGSQEFRNSLQTHLAQSLGPLYTEFVTCRTRMGYLQEFSFANSGEDPDEEQQEIESAGTMDEMIAVASLGRLHLLSALTCTSLMFQQVLPKLQSVWQEPGTGTVTPEIAGLLEEARLLITYMGHLLTDENDNNNGRNPVVPIAINNACNKEEESILYEIASAVQSVLCLAEAHASKLAENPSNARISPNLARSFLWFLNRWAPTYICGATSSSRPSKVLEFWSAEEAAQQVITFCLWFCSQYQSYWPHATNVHESSTNLLLSLAKRNPQTRSLMVPTSAFQQMIQFHCISTGLSPILGQEELASIVRRQAGNASISVEMFQGYHSLPQSDKSKILTVLLTACGDSTDTSSSMFNDCLKSVHEAFSSLMQALSSKQPNEVDDGAKEMTCRCIHLLCGVIHATDISQSERIPHFINPCLSHLSALMDYYAQDLMICELILGLFCDYAESWLRILDPDQSRVLFQASADLLKSYSAHHCTARLITPKGGKEAEAEEEQAYSDIICAIQLLIHLGATNDDSGGKDSSQATDVIFFGLQQIIPLMTQGLLQFPTLCVKFFSLVGFMMETHADKISYLPFELLDALLKSLLFGVTHHEVSVAKRCFEGIRGLAKEHLKSGALQSHLSQHPDIWDRCLTQILHGVVFQPLIWDRLEATADALLPLAAVDVPRFATIVNEICNATTLDQNRRLHVAFEKLIQQEVIAKVNAEGFEGRVNRERFKHDFEEFVNESHSFLLVR